MDERVTADNFETLNSHAQAGEQSTSPFSILSEYVTFSGDLEDRVGSSAMSLAFLLSALAICLLPKRYIPAALAAVASVVAELAYLSLG